MNIVSRQVALRNRVRVSTYHVRYGMRGIGDNGSAAGKIAGEGFSGGQTDVGGETQPENVLSLFVVVVAVIMV